mgnify:CR=1 FL=1
MRKPRSEYPSLQPEYRRAYYARTRGRQRGYTRKSRARHIEARREYDRRRYAAVPGRVAAIVVAGVVYRRGHPDEVRNRHRRERTGFTYEMFVARLAEQGGVCAICRGPFSSSKSTHADHSHTTGQQRGVLCGRCNWGLGYFRDNPKFLTAAAKYLRHWERAAA